MSQLTNYGENKLADWIRGEPLPLPTNWYVAMGSAASDAGVTELALTRQPVVRSLLAWAGTQGDGSTLASTGASHITSNNQHITFETPASALGTATHVGLYDAVTGGNCWAWLELPAPIVTSAGSPSPLRIEAGALRFAVGVAGCTNYLANKLVDLLFRGQAYAWPSPMFLSLYSSAPTNSGGGTEISAPGYDRLSMAPSLAALSGTQGAGTTSASSGTSGLISNNAALVFEPFSATIVAAGVHDAATAGNLLLWATLASPTTVQASGEPAAYQPGAFSILLA